MTNTDQLVRILLFVLCVIPACLAFVAFLVMIWSLCRVSSITDTLNERVIAEMKITRASQDQNTAVKPLSSRPVIGKHDD